MARKILVGCLVAAAAAAVAAAWLPQAPAPAPVAQPAPAPQVRAEERAFALPQRETLAKASGPLFSVPPLPSKTQAPPAVVQPAAPPMPYRVAGQLVESGALHIVLARGDAILTVREGDTLGDGWRVEAIRSDRVTLVYTPLDVRQDLAIATTLPTGMAPPPTAATAEAPARAARLRWDGPPRVAAGATFDVALKLTSAEAVKAAPLQLTYDPEVLEPVDVRAGGFFSDGLFSYRVYPGGSILIGASGKGAVPSDAEYLVVRFKPLRTSATAELKVAALALQSPAGRAIAHEAPASFRTVVGR